MSSNVGAKLPIGGNSSLASKKHSGNIDPNAPGHAKTNGLVITSEDVNVLVYRYLQESGFVHTAFTFAYESMVGKTNMGKANIPPGTLISFLQKGLQYVGIEETLRQDGSDAMHRQKEGKGARAFKGNMSTEAGVDFSLLSPNSIRALTRRDPPIKLNVPPATAAAAIKARLEAEAKAAEEAHKSMPPMNNMNNINNMNNLNNMSKPHHLPQYNASSQPLNKKMKIIPSAQDNLKSMNDANLAAQQAAAAMSQLHHSGLNNKSPISQPKNHMPNVTANDMNAAHQLPGNNTSAAAFAAQHRANMDLAAIHAQQQRSAAKLNVPNGMVEDQNLADAKAVAAAALASVAERTSSSNKGNGNGNGKGKGKSKVNKNSLASVGQISANTPKSVAMNPSQHQQQQYPAPVTASAAFELMDIAAARLEAKNGAEKNTSMFGTQQMQGQPGKTGRQMEMENTQSGDKRGNMPIEKAMMGNGAMVNKNRTSNAPVAELGNRGMATHTPPPNFNSSNQSAAEALAAAVLAGGTQHAQQHQIANNNIQTQSGSQTPRSIEEDDMLTRVRPDEVLELNKHTSEVFMCAWNPVFTDLIATGSGDASARIWQMAGPDARAGSSVCILLQHGTNATDRKNKDVTTLEWSSDGEFLATGSYDGVARVWRRTGALVHTLRSHRGPIFSLKWNKRGNFLLSGSYDKSTIVWDVSGDVGFVNQQFNHHFAPALDVDWKDDLTFASCSTDKTVHVCRVGQQRPIVTYSGHKDEVNAVKWDPSGTLLASCSDDCTAKIWDFSSGRKEPLHDFKSHQQEIYTVKWSPTGQGSRNPTKRLLLATASFDGSVRLWNVQNGTCIRVLSRHKDSVYSVSFSPSGEYLASGSLAGQLYIWKVWEGKHIKSFKGKGDIFEVAWNSEESRVAACFSSNVVNVIDFRMNQSM